METTDSSKAEDSFINTPFSRASLYAPISTIQDASRRNKPLPKSLQESALMDFLRQVSTNYHLNTVPSEAKSGRPLASSEMSNRIKSRALTLVGGGYHRTVGGGSKKQKQHQRKGKRADTEWNSLLENQELRERQESFLKELNALWNEYARNLLGMNETTTLDDSLRSKILAASSSMEWVGSFVQIESSKRHPAWTGRHGFLVEVTSNTWRVIEYDMEHDAATKGKDDDASSKQSMKVLVVPKHGSSLSVLLPTITGGGEGNTHSLPSKPCIRFVLRDSHSDNL